MINMRYQFFDSCKKQKTEKNILFYVKHELHHVWLINKTHDVKSTLTHIHV